MLMSKVDKVTSRVDKVTSRVDKVTSRVDKTIYNDYFCQLSYLYFPEEGLTNLKHRMRE